MTTYICSICYSILTFRPPEKRFRKYCFPHSDDYWGCDLCGTIYCDDCGKNLEHSCKYCDGGLFRNQRFEAKGLFKLPVGLRQLSKEECINKINKDYESGCIVKMEKEYWLKLIEELKNNTEQKL